MSPGRLPDPERHRFPENPCDFIAASTVAGQPARRQRRWQGRHHPGRRADGQCNRAGRCPRLVPSPANCRSRRLGCGDWQTGSANDRARHSNSLSLTAALLDLVGVL